MTNDSSTGGYLLPTPPPAPTPTDDAAFDDFLQAVVVGITGLPGNLVWPRWQITPPNLPGISTNWASIGVMDSEEDGFPYEAHDPILATLPIPPLPSPAPTPPPNGYDITIEHEVMEVLCSFYGPAARSNAKLVRSGLYVAQNREALQLAGIGLVDIGRITAVPALTNDQWYYRVDMPFRLRREIVRNYPILDLASALITLKSDTGASDTITVSNT